MTCFLTVPTDVLVATCPDVFAETHEVIAVACLRRGWTSGSSLKGLVRPLVAIRVLHCGF